MLIENDKVDASLLADGVEFGPVVLERPMGIKMTVNLWHVEVGGVCDIFLAFPYFPSKQVAPLALAVPCLERLVL